MVNGNIIINNINKYLFFSFFFFLVFNDWWHLGGEICCMFSIIYIYIFFTNYHLYFLAIWGIFVGAHSCIIRCIRNSLISISLKFLGLYIRMSNVVEPMQPKLKKQRNREKRSERERERERERNKSKLEKKWRNRRQRITQRKRSKRSNAK